MYKDFNHSYNCLVKFKINMKTELIFIFDSSQDQIDCYFS